MNINFKTLRQKNNLTVKQIADYIGVQEATVRKYECSDRLPSGENLLKLRNIFNCNDDTILCAFMYHKRKNFEKTVRLNFRKGVKNDGDLQRCSTRSIS